MSTGDKKFHTPLSRAKGHGVSHSGVHHWWVERVTSIALAVLTPWFVGSLILSMRSADVSQMAAWFAMPYNAIGMAALIIAMFWHAKLGLQVVVEDYVHTPFAKYMLLLANNALCWGFGLLGLMAVLRLHLIDITSYPT